MKDQYRFLIAHEIAHQYFGSSIGIHRKEIAWAPIGLGLVMDHHYMVRKGLSDESMRKTFRWYYLEALRRGFDTTLSQPVEKPMKEGPPWSFGWNMSLMHGKAYEVCRMLESLLGEEKFRDVIRKILSERKGALLSGADFIEYCEEACGEPLDWFVADWIDGKAALDYAVTSVKAADGSWEVEITKVGDAAFPVVVEAETERGKKLRQRIDRTKKVNRLVFATRDDLKSVVIDSDEICPDLDVSNNRWPKQTPSGDKK
jgi:aminopeptidase N